MDFRKVVSDYADQIKVCTAFAEESIKKICSEFGPRACGSEGEKNGQPRHKFAGNGLFPEQSDQPRDPRSGHRGAQKGNEDIRKTKREQQGVKIHTAPPGEIF